MVAIEVSGNSKGIIMRSIWLFRKPNNAKAENACDGGFKKDRLEEVRDKVDVLAHVGKGKRIRKVITEKNKYINDAVTGAR